MINKTRAEEAVGDIALQDNVTVAELAEYIFGPPFTQTDLQYADYLIHNAYLRSTAAPAPAPAPAGPTPKKGPTTTTPSTPITPGVS